MDRPRRWLWERPFLQEESEPSGLDRLFGTGSAVLERFEEQQVQVLGHQIDVGFEQAQHLAAMPQLVDSIDPASAEIQPGQTLFFFRARFAQTGAPGPNDIVSTAPFTVRADRPVQILPDRLRELPPL